MTFIAISLAAFQLVYPTRNLQTVVQLLHHWAALPVQAAGVVVPQLVHFPALDELEGSIDDCLEVYLDIILAFPQVSDPITLSKQF